MTRRHGYILGVVIAGAVIASVPLLSRGQPGAVVPDNSLALLSAQRLAMVPADERPPRKTAKNTRPSRKPYVVIDTHTNRIYLRTIDSVLFSALCSTGTGAELTDSTSGRSWRFDTPRGIFTVSSKLSDPLWRKPDWAFIEEGEPLPNDPEERFDPEAMGEYAIGFGDGYFIHGTIYERLIGVAVTHGCVRVGSDDLRQIYKRADIGTRVVIF
ncbi:MAG TPA: L,D-transpeptidase [candidate division Zixibacteria bacterium]|jgi:L,D-transpeptidase YbiS